MANKIQLLHASLLDDKDKLNELTYWLRVLDRPNGWHYDLDHIWILNELQKSGIQPGATIVDAGAGQGVMQYLLASRGFNVISLDFSSRKVPIHSIGIFRIKGCGDAQISYQHAYMKLINYETNQVSSIIKQFRINKIKKIPVFMGYLLRRLESYVFYQREKLFGKHTKFGLITYARAPFHDVALESNIADAMISVSAIEHADINLFDKNIKELTRLLKPEAPLLLTTSATGSKENSYDKKTSGWCFSCEALSKFFPDCDIEFDIEDCTKSLLNSKIFKRRLDPYYYTDEESPFYKKRFSTFPYLPVAVKLIK